MVVTCNEIINLSFIILLLLSAKSVHLCSENIQNMKKIITSVFVAAAMSAPVFAQLQLPAPSPKATFTQTVGLTDITIEYSAPGVKGRTIWGGVVPYDKLWRAGANSATKITFSRDVTIENTNVPKGSYSLFIIPTKSDWTIVLNKNASASTDEYKQDQDLLRIKTVPTTIPNRERLAYTITDFTDDMAVISMEWEKMRASFNVHMSTEKQAIENIDKATGSAWQTYNSAARYYLEKKDYEKAMGYANTSLSLSDQWFNNWVKAQILAGKGMNGEAYAYAQKAKELGDKNPQGFFFKDQVEKALVDWKPADGGKKKKK
jgi:hypothetical protein